MDEKDNNCFYKIKNASTSLENMVFMSVVELLKLMLNEADLVCVSIKCFYLFNALRFQVECLGI